MTNILEIDNLHNYFKTKNGLIKAVNGVSLKLKAGQTLGIIGESGSGKSQTAMSILKLFEKNQYLAAGKIIFDGEDISALKQDDLRKMRGNQIAMIFQEPMTSLNPVFNIEKQISEPLMLHRGLNRAQAKTQAIELLQAVKIPNPLALAKSYPHQLSGGMRQRVMIAMALACKPKLLIADEPTTALDVTIQAQILHLMNELKQQFSTSIMFISHDLGIMRQMADQIAIMYCGQVIEQAASSDIFDNNTTYMHPYTQALLQSRPDMVAKGQKRLFSIAGNVPHPWDLPPGCKFAPRCNFAQAICKEQEPPLKQLEPNHSLRCFFPDTRCNHEQSID